jgi:citrate synthase
MDNGLENVVAAETVLSHADGEAGELIIRGHRVDEIAGHVPFEYVVALLWADVVPDAGDASALRRALGVARPAAFAQFSRERLAGSNAVAGMRRLLAGVDEDGPLATPAGMLGAAAVAAAIAIRRAEGLEPIAPDPSLGHAADLLRMIRGTPGDDAEVAALDAYLVTVIDHDLNASTFTARVVASTRADLPSAIVAALSALKGPLHGGAPGPVLDMLDAIGSPQRAAPWIEAALDRGERLMGFGHRIYRVRDPRVDVLRRALATLHGNDARLALGKVVEEAALAALRRRKSARRLDVNVEFATALLLERLGIPRAGFTAVFAASRTAGWIAHAFEQQATGRIIRPASRYIGPMPLRRTA